MSSSKPIIVLLGAGPNTALETAKKFHSQGWQVVTVSRSQKQELAPYETLFIQADFVDPKTVEAAFEQIEAKVGIPNVITYNAYGVTFGTNQDDIFASTSVEDFVRDLNINTVSQFAAVKCAIEGFKKLPEDAPKVFIHISNMQTGLVVKETLTLGVGKNASLYVVESAAACYGSLARWYNADERDFEGNSTMDKINGAAHADAFWELVQNPKQQPINYTFVKGRGYVKFEGFNRPIETVPSLMEKAARNASA